jgi:hypothetical protein
MDTHRGAEYTPEEVQFLRALDRWQRRTHTRFPTATEVLAVAVSCGWRRALEPTPRKEAHNGHTL